MTTPHVVSLVFNGVRGDSRVIKTAQAAINAGYKSTLVGVSSTLSVEELEVEGVRVVLVPHRSSVLKKNGLWGERRDLRLLVGLYLEEALPHISSLEPDIIHSHDMVGLRVGAAAMRAIAASGRTSRWVHDVHEFVGGLKGEIQEQYMPHCLEWERTFFPEVDQLITVSPRLADELQERYCLKRPTVVYNAPVSSVDRENGAEVRGSIGLPDNVPLIVFVGGASPLRGCDTILEAVEQLPDVHLVMVSKGPYAEELSERAKNLGMGSRFHLHPYVESDQVSSFIRSADVGIHGLVHYPNAEVAMPNKLFEYLHAELPVVVSDVQSMAEFVKTHRIGVVFASGDAFSCAQAISGALERSEFYRSNITKDLKRDFSWESQEIKIQGIYSQLLLEPRQSQNTGSISVARAWLAREQTAHAERLAATKKHHKCTTVENSRSDAMHGLGNVGKKKKTRKRKQSRITVKALDNVRNRLRNILGFRDQ